MGLCIAKDDRSSVRVSHVSKRGEEQLHSRYHSGSDMADTYTTREVAKITGLGWSTVKRKCKEGEIPAFMKDGAYCILKGDLDDFKVRSRGRVNGNLLKSELDKINKVITYEKEENTIMSRLKQMVTRLTRRQNTSSIDSSLPTKTSPTSRFTRVSSSSKDMSMQRVSKDVRDITSLTSSCDTKTVVKR